MKAAHLISEMSFLRFVLGILIFIGVVFTSSDDKVPPSIIQDLKQHQYFKQGENIILQCKAKGPNLIYEWQKNWTYIQNTSHVKLANGYLNITSANAFDEAYYQCFAKNDYGTAMSDYLYLQYAMIKVSRPVYPISHQCEQGKKCSIVVGSSSQPPPAVITSDAKHTWLRGKDVLKLSKRIQVDDVPNGSTLYFAYVTSEDASTYEGHYNVSAYVEYLDLRVIIASYHLQVNSEHTDDTFAPEPTDLGQTTVYATVGSSAKMRCFFYGNPVPNITWTKGREKLNKTSNFDTQLEITNVSFADEGQYVCKGSNAKGWTYRAIRLLVGEAPKFVKESDHPYDATVQVGQNLTFHCNAEAVPKATVKWFRNGILLDVRSPPPRFIFSRDSTSLTIVNICLKCHDGRTGSDMMVIQCSAENRYGHVIRNGYVKVVSKGNKAELTNWLILLVVGLKSLSFL